MEMNLRNSSGRSRTMGQVMAEPQSWPIRLMFLSPSVSMISNMWPMIFSIL